MGLIKKIGFTEKRQVIAFLSVIMSGQIIYSGFEAFKGTFYNLLMESLGVNNTQMGILFSMIGISMFFYVPGGWVNNRFTIKSILCVSMFTRLITMLILIIFSPGFKILTIIAGVWGLTDAVFWPAVVNGVGLLSGKNNKGVAFGLLESVRRAAEMGMNLLVVGILSMVGGAILAFKGAMLAYTLLLIPMIYLVIKYVPKNKIVESKVENKNKLALKGLICIMKLPIVWMASLASLTVYWCYIILIFTVPYLQAVFHISTGQAAIFGIINTGAMGVVAGLISGLIADFIFKSSIKMMFTSLMLTGVSLIGVVSLPKTMSMLPINIILLFLFSFSLFLAKGIIMAPLAEIEIAEENKGALMSVGSFAAYASVFWAYALNGKIIDTNAPIIAYQKIFTIGAVVAIVGALMSLAVIYNKKIKQKEASDVE